MSANISPNLIKIEKSIYINGTEINSVNAREIHEYLKVKTKFADWIKRAIEKYDFIENQDYAILKNGNGNNAFIDYLVSIDMAKELAMLENNPKGKETRKYFIYFEQRAKEVINNQSQEIQLLQGMLNTISKMDTRVSELEKSKRLENWQEKELQDLKNKKVYELAKKHDLENDNEMIRKLHSRVWKAVKNRFNLPRYNELPILKFDEAKALINGLSLGDLI
jgi:phage anti-repressor protein